jgi:hypothetical protein
MMVKAACTGEAAFSGPMTQAARALPEPVRLVNTGEINARDSQRTSRNDAQGEAQGSERIRPLGQTIDNLVADAVAGHGRYRVILVELKVAGDVTGVANVRGICEYRVSTRPGQGSEPARTLEVHLAPSGVEDGRELTLPDRL